MTTVVAKQARYPRGERAIAVFGTWMITGLFIDGWAHEAEKPETFFSPWHLILYSGFVAAVAFFVWDGRRQAKQGAAVILDPGDRLTTIGLVLFVAGAVGDGLWHEIFGIEVDLEALLSPTHLLLLIGGFLMVTTAVRGAWADPEMQAPSLREFVAPLVALTLATALVLFFTQYLNVFEGVAHPNDRLGYDREVREVQGLAAVLATNLIVMFAVVHTLRRLRPPGGTFTVLFSGVALLMAGMEGFDLVELALPMLVAGVTADLLVPRVPRNALLAAVPAVLWSTYYLVAEISYGVAWTPELWAGSIVLASASSVLLGALASDRAAHPATT